jgi:hypothetical protein
MGYGLAVKQGLTAGSDDGFLDYDTVIFMNRDARGAYVHHLDRCQNVQLRLVIEANENPSTERH